jgi:endonuclease YncB( thermonuclease family)
MPHRPHTRRFFPRRRRAAAVTVATALLASAVALLAAPIPAHADIVGRATVIDGNTVKIGRLPMVLWGINAPHRGEYCPAGDDMHYPCGKVAARTLGVIIQDKELSCEPKGPDERGIMRAVCRIDNADINQTMVLNGWAVAYREETLDYVQAERAAWVNREGMWKIKTFRAADVMGRKPR